MLDEYMPALFDRLLKLNRETTTEADARNLIQIETAFNTIKSILEKASSTARVVIKFRLLTQDEKEVKSFYSYEEFEKHYDELEDDETLKPGDTFLIAMDVE